MRIFSFERISSDIHYLSNKKDVVKFELDVCLETFANFYFQIEKWVHLLKRGFSYWLSMDYFSIKMSDAKLLVFAPPSIIILL